MKKFGEGYKVLIADDEPIIIERLALNLKKVGFEITGLAETGKQALDLYKETSPDIIISDIAMPIISGIELLETIRLEDKMVKFIFFTGYSEFNYAMSALKHDASDYLLKPLDSKKLFDVLQKVIDKIEEEEELESLIKENEILKDGSLIYNFLSDGTVSSEMKSETKSWIEDPDGIRMLMIYGKIDQIETEENLYLMENDNYIMFFKKGRRDIDKLCSSLSYSALGIPCHTGKDLRESYRVLRRTLLNRFFFPEKHFYKYETSQKADKDKVQALDQQNQKLIQNHKFEELAELIDIEIRELKTPENLEYFVYLIKGLLLRGSDKNLGPISINHSPIWILERFSDIESFSAWLQTLILKIYSPKGGKADLDLPSRVKQYLDENYTSSLSLETIAVNVFAHPNYISTKFKEEMGVTVTEYLCSIRLTRAKELLTTTNLTCKKISLIVGFQDQFYFCKCFKKQYGVTPTSLQKKR
jgi:two-component system, response regulator YesN